MESFELKAIEANQEQEAEKKLEEILEDPDNAFLTEHKMNLDRIEDAETAVEALRIAEELILKRLERTFEFRLLKPVEGMAVGPVNFEGIKRTIDSIKSHQELIGEGGDAFVVVDKNEIREFPPEICYKFAKAEQTPRGRNPMSYEAEIHGDFYEAAKEISNMIGVPMPFYSTELGHDKIIAMEKLPAKSVDDVLRGMGGLPDWFDVDMFCDELKHVFDELHRRGLYHRDMHVGNLMITQSATPPEDGKWGYIIDFGLSGYGSENMDPYRKELAGQVFTYANDYDIIESVRRGLNDYRNRKERENHDNR